ncbi:ABC transporter ATP-binding protein [Chryseobacterium sp. ISL-6]|uniref:ABC transporter ATP-binding protein n=1 Tax=Chryseobacterium sp. ISL-6 TaxID=2819143 RepID=UPI001BE8C587|nr:ABC transporter ATP-binding protein [Chryseobacterium sp. ISL-6]MBT2620583.1 ABC transporter ATP-binding protein [Chryseobacterium sp. ISL-6]
MENIINIKNLSFGFTKHTPILKNLNFSVPKGSIFGFLGANGAGKSTTMKLLVGSIPDESNSITIDNQKIAEFYPEGFNRVGSLIDAPSFYDHLSGWDNLLILSKLRKLPEMECERVLHLVDLWENRNMKTKKYSLGMKQRLGIAMALLGNSELLILDEPVNGLDPSGMIEMRELLMDLNKKHKTTIFISSHLLQEIEKMITHLAVISKGEIKFSGSIRELREQQIQHVRVGVFGASQFMNQIPDEYCAMLIDKDTLDLTIGSKNELAILIRKLVMKNAEIFEIRNNLGLEEWFMELTKNKH